MTEEKDLVPFESGSLPEGPWIVFSPHPDDESFGMGGSLLLAKDNNINVSIVFLTSGGWSDDHDADASKIKESMKIRESEAVNVCDALGVIDYQFWREKDRGLSTSWQMLEKIKQSIKNSAAKSVFLPAPTELHPDHRKAAELVWQVCRTLKGNIKYYTYDIGNQSPINLLIDITITVNQKQKLMSMYVSQVTENPYITLVNSLDIARTFTLPSEVIAAEGFYELPVADNYYGTTLTQTIFNNYQQKLVVNSPPIISVIVRTKDRPEYLYHALTSIVEQSYPYFEVLVINDGGVDVEKQVLENFSKIINIRYFDIYENCGRSKAANKGLLNASGDYIAFLDDDDWLDRDHFSSLCASITASNHQPVYYTGVRVINTDKDSEVVRKYNEAFDRNRLFYDNYIPINSVLISREIIEKNACLFDEELDCFEDWDFWLQLLKYTDSFTYVEGITANYRVHGAATTAVTGGHDEVRRKIFIRWSKEWDEDVTYDLLSRLFITSQSNQDGYLK